MAEGRRIKVGEKVWVRQYPHDAIGEVLEVYGPRGHRSALVRIRSMGPSGEVQAEWETSYPIERLRLAESDAA
jgi:hypothetical protein